MTFKLDLREELAKRGTTPANPAKAANPVNKAERISKISDISKGEAAFETYTGADLAEMRRLLLELAEMEARSPAEIEELKDEFNRMAPVRVMACFREIKAAHAAALAKWPEPPAQRRIPKLCVLRVIEGGKNQRQEQDAPQPEAA